MASPAIARWGFRARLAAAAGLSLFGFDLPLFGVAMIPLALALVFAGTAWFVALMIRPAPGETAAPPRRKQIALSVATSVLMLVLLLALTTSIHMGSGGPRTRPAWRPGAPTSPQMSDPDLGWAPFGPPDLIGQRLERMDPARPHVLLMGDSILYGYGVTGEEQVGRRLEALLPGHQVLNASVSGYSIDQYLLTLERVVPVVKPRLIVLGIFTGNDFQISSREFSFGNHKPVLLAKDGELVRADVAGPCVDRLSHSLLFRVLWQSRELSTYTIESICRPLRLSRAQAEESIATMFDAMDALASKHGARILHVLLPVDSEFVTYAKDRYLYVSRHPDLWRLLGAERNGLPPRERFDFSIDLFRGGRQPAELFQSDHAHLTPSGHEFLARTLLREIEARKLLEPLGP